MAGSAVGGSGGHWRRVSPWVRDGRGDTDAGAVTSLAAVNLASGEKLKVVATTSLVADVVSAVGGDKVDLTRLMPLGADPHAFEPTPQDAAAISEAHVVFINGVGLEAFMDRLLANAAGDVPVVPFQRACNCWPLRETMGTMRKRVGQATTTARMIPTRGLILPTCKCGSTISSALISLDPAHAAEYRGMPVPTEQSWMRSMRGSANRSRTYPKNGGSW